MNGSLPIVISFSQDLESSNIELLNWYKLTKSNAEKEIQITRAINTLWNWYAATSTFTYSYR